MVGIDELHRRRAALIKSAEVIQTEGQRQLIGEALVSINNVLDRLEGSSLSTNPNPPRTKEVINPLVRLDKGNQKDFSELGVKEAHSNDAAEGV